MFKRFFADRRGVFAVEMAICFPVIIIAMGGLIVIAQKQNLLRNSQFVIQAGASAGQGQVQSIVNQNAVLFLAGWQKTVTVSDNGNNTFTASINSSEPALFPLFGDTVQVSASVTVANPAPTP